MSRIQIRAGEALAVSPDAIKSDADGFFIMGVDVPETEKVGQVAIVHVRGALSHFATPMGDSYQAIVSRVVAALADRPKAIILQIDSPGGVVAGLNESVRQLRKLTQGTRFIAYVDEMAASAAYAICCACDEILAPPSAIVGSVGVISTMVSQAKADEMMGIEFRLITSGARKADGHLHAPISDAAEAAEKERNDELAKQFFELASEARGMTSKKLAGLEAAIYLCSKAKAVGLIDDVMSLDDVISTLHAAEIHVAPNEGNRTDRIETLDNLRISTSSITKEEAEMSVKLDQLIIKTEAGLASTSDAKLRTKLAMDLAGLQATKRLMGEDPDDDKDDDSDDDSDDDDPDEGKAAKAKKAEEKAARKAEAAKHKAAAAKHRARAAEYEEKAKKCEEEGGEKDDDEASTSVARLDAELSSAGASAAIEGQTAITANAVARLAAIEKERAEEKKALAVQTALSARKVTPAEAKHLLTQPSAFVDAFLAMRPRAIVATDDTAMSPDGTPQSVEMLSKSALAEIDKRVSETMAAIGGDMTKDARDKIADKMKADLIASRRNSNGIAGRV
jgi:signal peptide peptidase SppA